MNVKLFYLFSLLLSLWFVEPVWYFYWGKFATYTEIGVMFTILTAVWILAEIPSGVFADKYGRKTSTIIGAISLAFGSWILAGAQNAWWLLAGGFFHNIGRAFISGALEALVYDDLVRKGKESDFDKIISRKAQFTIIGFALATIIGGYLYSVYFRLPHILMSITATVAAISTFFFRENRIVEVKIRKTFITQIISGIKQLANENLKPYIFPSITVLTLYFLFDWGFSKPAIAVISGFFAKEQGVLYAIFSIVSFFLIGYLPKMRKKFGDMRAILFITLIIGSGFLIGSFKLGIFGFIPLLILSQSTAFAEPLVSAVVNSHIDSKYRATTLSTLQFAGRLPFNIITIFIGNSIDKGYISQFHLFLGLTVILCIFIYFGKKITSD